MTAAITPGRDELVLIADVRSLLGSCGHDMGFDRELGPMGCRLDAEGGGGCVCAGIAAGLARLAANPASDPDAMNERRAADDTRLAANVREATIEECAEKISNMRQSEAGLFDPMHSGQRGQDRSDALLDAYRALRKLSPTGAPKP